MPLAWISLGSNLGDRRAHLAAALKALRAPELGLQAHSRVWETEPVGYAEQPAFLNMAARLATRLPPGELLTALQAIEKAEGKATPFRWGPRSLDLDIMLYEGQALALPELTLPHPRLHERAFMMGPLLELDPELAHPLLGLSFHELLQSLPPGHPAARPVGNLDSLTERP